MIRTDWRTVPPRIISSSLLRFTPFWSERSGRRSRERFFRESETKTNKANRPKKEKDSVMKISCAANPNSLLRPAIPLMLAAMTLLVLATFSVARADQGQDNRAPDVPAALSVPDGNK